MVSCYLAEEGQFLISRVRKAGEWLRSKQLKVSCLERNGRALGGVCYLNTSSESSRLAPLWEPDCKVRPAPFRESGIYTNQVCGSNFAPVLLC